MNTGIFTDYRVRTVNFVVETVCFKDFKFMSGWIRGVYDAVEWKVNV